MKQNLAFFHPGGGVSRRRFFTLIELLVVIAIIAILASLLLPALSRANYVAKNAVCMQQIKQMYIGLFTYTVDNDTYYPGWGPEDDRDTPTTLQRSATKSLRPVYREYFGTDRLRNLMVCPLTADWWANSGSNYSKIDTYSGLLKTSYAFFFKYQNIGSDHWNYKTPRMRAGQPMEPVYQPGKYSVLISDFTINHWTYGHLDSAQKPLTSSGTICGNYVESSTGYWIEPPLEASANFCLDDGSTKTYTVSMGGVTNGTLLKLKPSGNGWVIPADTRVE